MITRRLAVTASMSASLIGLAGGRARAAGGFDAFLGSVANEARRRGVSEGTLRAALGGLQPNQKVLDLDRSQPEFTQTWQHYRDTRVSTGRISAGRAAYAQDRSLLDAIRTEYGVDPGVIMGIWGLETNYGGFTGGFNVVEALATLAWDGRRASYFRPELIAALGILDHGDVSVVRMKGSYAGAMGQPQFMPSSYLRYAVDFDGDGKRDIWDDRSDVLASIANYLARSGWRADQGWGAAVILPEGFSAAKTDKLSLSAWSRRGVRRADGRRLAGADVAAHLVLPAGPGGQAFLAFPNFTAIRRYNPSDFYALAVGLLGDQVAG